MYSDRAKDKTGLEKTGLAKEGAYLVLFSKITGASWKSKTQNSKKIHKLCLAPPNLSGGGCRPFMVLVFIS